MSPSLTALAYLVAAVLFILALRGLSNPTTSRQGNLFGMVGMGIAIVATLLRTGMSGSGYALIIAGIVDRRRHRRHRVAPHPDDGAAAAGGGVPLAGRLGRRVRGRRGAERAGSVRHRHARPHLWREPGRDVDRPGHRRGDVHRVADRLRQAAGADEGDADHLQIPAPAECGAGRAAGDPDRRVLPHGQPVRVLADRAGGAGTRLPADHPDRRGGHAGRGVDAEQLFRLGGVRHRLHHPEPGVDHHRRAGGRLGRDPVLHHVQGHEPLDLQRAAGWLRHRQRRGGGRGRRAARPSRCAPAMPRTRRSS